MWRLWQGTLAANISDFWPYPPCSPAYFNPVFQAMLYKESVLVQFCLSILRIPEKHHSQPIASPRRHQWKVFRYVSVLPKAFLLGRPLKALRGPLGLEVVRKADRWQLSLRKIQARIMHGGDQEFPKRIQIIREKWKMKNINVCKKIPLIWKTSPLNGKSLHTFEM